MSEDAVKRQKRGGACTPVQALAHAPLQGGLVICDHHLLGCRDPLMRPDCRADDGRDATGASEADAEEPRPRRGGAAPNQAVSEKEIRTVIEKLQDSGEYGVKMIMLQKLLKLQVESCNVGGQSAFKTWLKLAKDACRSLAEGTDAIAVLLQLLEDVDGTLKRVQGQTPLNPKTTKEQKAVRKIVPKARRILLSYTACPPTTAFLTPLHAACPPTRRSADATVCRVPDEEAAGGCRLQAGRR